MANIKIHQEEFDNIVSLFRTHQIDSIQLGMCLVMGQQCYTQFQDHFVQSFKKFQYFLKNIILVAVQSGKSNWIINRLILHIIDGEPLPSSIISDIIIYNPQLYKKFNLDQVNGLYISCILRQHPHLYTEFNLSKCDKGDIEWITQFHPQLGPHFK